MRVLAGGVCGQAEGEVFLPSQRLSSVQVELRGGERGALCAVRSRVLTFWL